MNAPFARDSGNSSDILVSAMMSIKKKKKRRKKGSATDIFHCYNLIEHYFEQNRTLINHPTK